MLLQRLKSIVFEIFLRSDRPFGNVEFSLWSKQRCFPKLNFLRDSSPLWLTSTTKVELISKPAPTHIFKQFPTNIWISKFFVLMIFAVKMRLEPMGYWISLNFNVIFFNSLFVVESEFQNSNVGGKKLENLCRCQFWNKFDFRIWDYILKHPWRFRMFSKKNPYKVVRKVCFFFKNALGI